MKHFMKITPYYTNDELNKMNIAKTDYNSQKGNEELKPIGNKIPVFKVYVTDLEVTVNVDVQSYQMIAPNSNEKAGFAHYHSSDGGYTLKVECITSDKDESLNMLNLKWLEKYFIERRAVNVVIDSKPVANGVYDISKFEGFHLLRKNTYEFSIELTTHTSTKPKLTNKVTVLQTNLKHCAKPKGKVVTTKQVKNGYYYVKKGKKKTKVTLKPSSCIGYLNQVLYKKGCYTTSKGKKTAYKKYKKYFTKYTTSALKKYGKKWNKKGLKPKVNEKGKLSKNMWTAIKRYPEL